MDLPQSPLRDIAAYTYMYIFYIISILNCQKEDIGRKTQSALCILHFFFGGSATLSPPVSVMVYTTQKEEIKV